LLYRRSIPLTREDRLVFPTSATPSAIDADPTFQALGWSLPRELREEADSMSAAAFHAKYTPSGPLRLGHWRCTDPERGASSLGPQPRNYQATIAVGDRIGTATAAAGGPVAALTAMLHDRGIAVEIGAFHQRHADGGTATFVRGTDGLNVEWAAGWSDDVTQSALRAVLACANRLQAAASTA
jgi:hypothetical protein